MHGLGVSALTAGRSITIRLHRASLSLQPAHRSLRCHAPVPPTANELHEKGQPMAELPSALTAQDGADISVDFAKHGSVIAAGMQHGGLQPRVKERTGWTRRVRDVVGIAGPVHFQVSSLIHPLVCFVGELADGLEEGREMRVESRVVLVLRGLASQVGLLTRAGLLGTKGCFADRGGFARGTPRTNGDKGCRHRHEHWQGEQCDPLKEIRPAVQNGYEAHQRFSDRLITTRHLRKLAASTLIPRHGGLA